MRLTLVSPGRTSSGGAAFVEQLRPELERLLARDVPHVTAPILRPLRLTQTLLDSTHVVFLGSRARRVPGAMSVFWPLNVAPLEHHVAEAKPSSTRNRVRHTVLRHRLGVAVGRADGLAFGSFHARTLYMAAYPAAASKPYVVVRGGTPSGPLHTPAVSRVVRLDGRLVLAVSHLYPYKGILQLVEAIAAIDDRLPRDVVVRVAGADRDAKYAARVHERIRELGLQSRIHVAPADVPEMRSLYTQAEVAVFPSTCENAGSFALFDGLHAGCPTICSDRSSMPEMVGEAVSLVNPYDVRSLGDEILRVVESPETRAELSLKATRWAQTAPTWAERAETLVNWLSESRSRPWL